MYMDHFKYLKHISHLGNIIVDDLIGKLVAVTCVSFLDKTIGRSFIAANVLLPSIF